MSKTIDKQFDFAVAVAVLILFIKQRGKHKVTLGDAYRDPRCGYGHPKSKHRERLAIDLNLFDLNGTYLTQTKVHEPYGIFWEQMGGRWGGHWNDGNHYEWPA